MQSYLRIKTKQKHIKKNHKHKNTHTKKTSIGLRVIMSHVHCNI